MWMETTVPHRSRMQFAMTIMIAVLGGASPHPARAQAVPDAENGRYSLAPLPDGSFLRLDTRSGAVSKCVEAPGGWECWLLPDERAAFDAEIGRLQADNESLRAQLAQANAGKDSGKRDDAFPKSDSLTPSMPRSADGERKIEIPLPSDRDIDRVMSFFEQLWRRLVEMTGRIQRDASGKI